MLTYPQGRTAFSVELSVALEDNGIGQGISLISKPGFGCFRLQRAKQVVLVGVTFDDKAYRAVTEHTYPIKEDDIFIFYAHTIYYSVGACKSE